MNLAQYYNNFMENGLINLEKIVSNTLECNLNISPEPRETDNIQIFVDNNIDIDYNKKLSYEDLEKIGIKKPGHIYKILTRIEFDAKLINQNLDIFINTQSQYDSNKLDITHSTSSLRISNPKTVCCAFKTSNNINTSNKKHLCKKNSSNSNSNSSNNKPRNDIDLLKFLEKYKLKKFERNFIFNGFDSMEYIFLQLFSSFRFDEEMIENRLHIYDVNDRKKILICIIKELKELNLKLGLSLNLNAFYDDSLNNILEQDTSNIFENTKVEEGCKACLIF